MTAVFLFMIELQFSGYFGMPKKELMYLSVIAGCFCMYSVTCFLFLKRNLRPFFKVIGVANLFYCALTIGLLIAYYPLLTTIGMSYFLMEIVIICVLSYVELHVATVN